jgi:hypothetical protein
MADPIVLQCANSASLEKPHSLGPLDTLILPFCPIPVIFVYPCAAGQLPVDLLKRSLETVLDTYPQLTGRLKLGDGYPVITALGTGAALYTATRPERLSDLAPGRLTMPDLPECGNPLLPPFDATLEGVQRQPILLVKHTRFACGAVALGITLHHYACDATGYFQFMRDLSDVFAALRSGNTPTVAPANLKAYCPRASGSVARPEHLALESQVVADPIAEGSTSMDAVHPPDAPPVHGRVLRFSAAELAGIKAAALGPGGPEWISTHEALTAHIWQRTYRARVQLVGEETARHAFNREMLSSINVRPANRLGLPARYFPNAIYHPCGKLDHDTLFAAPFPRLTGIVHDIYRCPTPDKMEEYAAWIAQQEAAGRARSVHQTFNYGPGCFVVTQWTGFRMYEGTGFDGVDPILVAQPFTPISLLDGLAMMYATEEKDSIDVNLCLSEPVWAVLDADSDFRRHQVAGS